jgi:hypothetical protein
MATRKKGRRTTSKKRGAKRASARAKGSPRRSTAARRRARKGAQKRIDRAASAVRRRARQGVEVAKEGLGKVKELGEKTWGTVKSATGGVVQSVRERLTTDSDE